MSARSYAKKAIRSVEERNALVVANLRLTTWAVNRWWIHLSGEAKRMYPHDDASADAHAGLIRAAELWDEKKGKLSTFAWQWMRNYMNTGLHRAALIRTPDRWRRYDVTSFEFDDNPELFMPAVCLESIVDVDDERRWLCRQVQEAIDGLDPRWASIVRMRMSGLTLMRIGAHFRVNKERIRQILAKSYQKLHESLGSLTVVTV
jgi:RNA polymerase sigma factor (sigma-70 family)